MRPAAGSSQNARTPEVPPGYAVRSAASSGWKETGVVGWVATARLAHHTVNFRRGAHPPRGEERRTVNARRTGGWREDPADREERPVDLYRLINLRFASPLATG